MSSFIVIGTQTKLAWMADGIKNCRPHDASVGKIDERDGILYYSSLAKSNENDKSKLNECILNHIATFRAVANNKAGMLNIFLLENPFSDKEYEDLTTWWLPELEKVFAADPNLHFYRILFTYDLNEPYDVTRHIPTDILTSYFKGLDSLSFKDSMHVMLLGNRNRIGAAVSLNKEEHDFKLPRMLADLMTLLSDNATKPNVLNAINISDRNCFTLGYAESMYYFPDVKEYYQHADMRDLYTKILNDDETAEIGDDMAAMSVEDYPLGLYKRKKRLEKYSDVPIGENLYADRYKDSADRKIEDCLNQLKDPLCRARSNDDPDCPEFPNRKDIYDHFCGLTNEDERDEYLSNADRDYKKLVAYARGNDFFDFVKKEEEEEEDKRSTDNNNPPAPDKPCLCKRIAILLGIQKAESQPQQAESAVQTLPKLTDVIRTLREQCGLKEAYKSFVKETEDIELEQKREDDYCKNFKLKDHTQHYYHLIDLVKLKENQKADFNNRYVAVKTIREGENGKTLTRLKELMRDNTNEHVRQFKYIDWASSFPAFVADTSDEILAKICNSLYKKSTPFIHYSVTTIQATNDTTLALYSDMPNFDKKFNGIKQNVNDGNSMSANCSELIKSKICFFQFLPLPADELKAFIEELAENDDPTI